MKRTVFSLVLIGFSLATAYASGPLDTQNYWVRYAIEEVLRTDGVQVSVHDKAKAVRKFGENTAVGTSNTTLMTLHGSETEETYVSTNAIDSISSSDASDTGLIYLEGHTVSSGVFTFRTQSVTLNGQTRVALDPALSRSARGANISSSPLAGSVYVYENTAITAGVPDDASKTHLIIPVGEEQSLKASTTFSDEDYCFLTRIIGTVNKRTAGGATIRLRVREAGGVPRTQLKYGVNSNGPPLNKPFTPYVIIKPNSDVYLDAIADQSNTPVDASFHCILAKIVN